GEPGDAAVAVAFSPDGKWLIAGTRDLTLRVWEVATGKEVHRFDGTTAFTDIVVAADGKTFASGGDVAAVVWSLRPKDRPTEHVEVLWEQVGSSDARLAYRATWALAERPADAIPLLRAKIAPQPAADPQKIADLITDLASPNFKTREAAAQALAKLDG